VVRGDEAIGPEWPMPDQSRRQGLGVRGRTYGVHDNPGAGMIAPAPCGSCGAVNLVDATFCSKCGDRLLISPTQVDGPGGQAPPATVVPAGIHPPSAQPYPGGYGPGAPYAPAYGGYPPGYALYPAPQRATVGAMIGNTFGVWVKDILSHILLFLISTGITVGLTLGVTYLVLGAALPVIVGGGPPAGAALAAFLGVAFAAAVAGVAISTLFVGTSAYIAVRRQRGQPASLSEAFRHVIPKLPSLLGGTLVQIAIPLALLIVPLTLIVVGAGSITPTDFSAVGLVLGACLLFVLLIPLALYISVKFALAIPCIVADGNSAVEGLKRSWRLLAGRWWTYFAAAIVVGILAAVVEAVAASSTGSIGNPFLRAAGQILGGAITGSWSVILASVGYTLITQEQTVPLQPVYAAPVPYWQPGMPPPRYPPGR